MLLTSYTKSSVGVQFISWGVGRYEKSKHRGNAKIPGGRQIKKVENPWDRETERQTDKLKQTQT